MKYIERGFLNNDDIICSNDELQDFFLLFIVIKIYIWIQICSKVFVPDHNGLKIPKEWSENTVIFKD